jgi:hypothetical protein
MRFLGMGGVEYEEGDRRVIVDGAFVLKPVKRVIYLPLELRWSPPHASESISDEKSAEILARIIDWFETKSITYELLDTQQKRVVASGPSRRQRKR